MKGVQERIAIVEQVAASAHKRVDGHDREILSLREARHQHSNMLQAHEGTLHTHNTILTGINSSVEKLSDVVGSLSKSVDKIVWLFAGGMFIGSMIIAAILYMGKEFFKLW